MAISFNQIPSGIRVPLFYAEFDNSMANTAVTNLKTLIVGQMTSGAATVGKPVLVTGVSQGHELFGRGSQLARINDAYRANDDYGEVWAIPVADPEGGTAASCSVTVSGEATASGSVFLYVGATRVAANVAIGDTAASIATALAAAVNAKPDLPVTAQASSGTVVLNAKNAGTQGNDIRVAVNRAGYAAGEVLPEGISATVSAMAGGAGVPDLEAVIAAMGDEQYDLIAMPFADANSLNQFSAEMNDVTGRWSPTRQLYGHVFTALRGTVATLQAFGSARNDQHATVVGIESGVASAACEVLGAYVGRAARALNTDPARPLQTLELIGITPAPEGERFSLTEKQTLLTSGISTEYTQGGYMRIERAITTYQKNASDVLDNSYLDVNTLFTLMYIVRDLKSVITSKYPRHKLADDGTFFGSGQAVVTPSVIRAELLAEYRKLEERALVENFDAFKANLIVERNADDPTRLDVLLPPDLVNQLRIFAALIQFRLQY